MKTKSFCHTFVPWKRNSKHEKVENEVIEENIETADSKKGTTSCNKCDFIAKSEGGLKTHITTKHKHKTVSLKGYKKVS